LTEPVPDVEEKSNIDMLNIDYYLGQNEYR
jgi:hypothetical protein